MSLNEKEQLVICQEYTGNIFTHTRDSQTDNKLGAPDIENTNEKTCYHAYPGPYQL